MGYPNTAQVDAAVSASGSPKPDTSLTNALLKDMVDYLGTRATPTDKVADFTFAVSDTHPIRIVRSNSGSSITGTVPPNASVNITTNTVIQLCRYGAGAFLIAAGAGVTIRRPSDRGLSLRAQYSAGALWKVGTDEWILMGDLT